MFTVTLYESFSKPTNSTKSPNGDGTAFQCEIIEPCGILTPRISFNMGNAWNPSGYNYCNIPVWNRYYFVTEWTFVNGLWYADLQCDVLASHKAQILTQSEYVTRSASSFSTNVIDTMYPANVHISRYLKSTFVWEHNTLLSGCYVIGIMGNNNSTVGGVAYYVTTAGFLNTLTEHMLGSTDWIGKPEEISEDLLRCLVNPMQYITSIMWFPYTQWSTESSPVSAGWWDTGVALGDCGDTAPVLDGSLGTFIAHPQADRGNYLNYPPYTEMYVEFPPFGKISIDPYKYGVPGDDIRYQITTDPISGMAMLQLYGGYGVGTGDTLMGKIGVSLSVGQATSSVLGIVGATMTPAINDLKSTGFALDKATGNILGTIGDALQTTSPQLNVINANAGVSMFKKPSEFSIIHRYVVDDDNEHLGRPLCKKVTLSSLSGYTQVLDADVNISCMNTEREAIRNFMEGGFYIE